MPDSSYPWDVVEVSLGPGPVASEITRAALVGLGSTTHQFDQSQRYVPVEVLQAGGPQTVRLLLPSNPNELPDGWYMLFVLTDDGVPARAPYVRIEG